MIYTNNDQSFSSSLDTLAEVATRIKYMNEDVRDQVSESIYVANADKSDSAASRNVLETDKQHISVAQSVNKGESLLLDNQRKFLKKLMSESITYNEKSDLHSFEHKKSFPEILMDILSSKEFEGIISWLPQGNAFIIIDKENLVKNVLSIYFNGIKYKSFTSKIQRWGFKRFVKGEGECDVFYHKRFLRDSPGLCKITHIRKDVERTAKISDTQKQNHNENQTLDNSESKSLELFKMQSEVNRKNQQCFKPQLLATSYDNVMRFNNPNSSSLYADKLVHDYFNRKMDQIRNLYFPKQTRLLPNCNDF